MSADELRDALGITLAEINEAVEDNRLFAFEGPDGAPYYPAFFAVADVDRSALELAALELRGHPAASKYYFFKQVHQSVKRRSRRSSADE